MLRLLWGSDGSRGLNLAEAGSGRAPLTEQSPRKRLVPRPSCQGHGVVGSESPPSSALPCMRVR